ncbi:MAG: hypothetical protein WD401_07130, partial [Thermomicrobiaceae bacterium]
MWEGNSLIIGRSHDHSVLLRPETDYRITVLEDAEDHHGNPIGEHWTLQFQTGPRDVSMTTPTSLPTVEPDPGNQMNSSETATPGNWSPSQDDQDEPDGEDRKGSQNGQATVPAPTSEPAPESENAQNSQNQGDLQSTVEDEANEEQSQTQEPQPTPTSQPDAGISTQPTESPEQNEQPTATPEPKATSTPEPEPTPTEEPDPVPSAEPYPVQGAFGEVYWGKDEIADALGVATQDARSFLASEQEFQRGIMFRQHNQTRNSILVFANGSPVRVFDNNYNAERDKLDASEQEEGLHSPGGYFGKVWHENESLQDIIGLAVTPEPHENIDGAIQQFANGQLVFSDGSVYVIYADGNWDVYSVRSGSSGGFQGGEDTDNESDQESDADEGDDSPDQTEDSGGNDEDPDIEEESSINGQTEADNSDDDGSSADEQLENNESAEDEATQQT